MPVETKVFAQGTTALTGAVLAQLVIQLLQQHAHINIDTNTANEIVAFFAVIPGLIAGYRAPHTNNPESLAAEAQRLLEAYLAATSRPADPPASSPPGRITIPAPASRPMPGAPQ